MTNQLKITISGPPCSGKTSIAYAIHNLLRSVSAELSEQTTEAQGITVTLDPTVDPRTNTAQALVELVKRGTEITIIERQDRQVDWARNYIVTDPELEAPTEATPDPMQALRTNLEQLEVWTAHGINAEFGKFGAMLPKDRSGTATLRKMLWLLRKKHFDVGSDKGVFELMHLAGRKAALAALDEVISEIT